MARNHLRPVEPEDEGDDEEEQETVEIAEEETELFDRLRDLDYVDFCLVGGHVGGVPALIICIDHAKRVGEDEPILEPLYARLSPDQAAEVSFGEDEARDDDVVAKVVRKGRAKRAARGR
jgi:hypothetical protein